VPITFVAATRNTYEVPFVSPVTVSEVVAEVVGKVVQVEPESLE
jgi:hypothetical protein